jgi:hypothetical protein
MPSHVYEMALGKTYFPLLQAVLPQITSFEYFKFCEKMFVTYVHNYIPNDYLPLYF